MKLNHHYTLKITCDPPPKAFMLGGGSQELPVITIHGDYATVHEALTSGDVGSVSRQLARFEQTLNADDPAGQE